MLAERDDVGDGGVKFLLGQLHLAHEFMQVANEGGHDLLEPGIRRALQLGQDRGRDVLLIFNDHELSSSAPFARPPSPSADGFSRMIP